MAISSNSCKKKMPERTCAGCMQVHAKSELIRIVKSAEGTVSVDRTGKANGRGVYLCPNTDCFETVRKNKGLERSLKMKVDDIVFDELEKAIRNGK